jgi:hypothetical protein
MRCMRDWESREPLISSIRENLKAIWANQFMSLDEYRRRVESGRLARAHRFRDDRAFQKANPAHPLASDNRFARTKAADAIRDAAKQISRPLPGDLLTDIHKTLFDCCAPVRHALSQALFFAGGPQSAQVLERLLKTESESNMVKSSARVALERCRMRDPANKPSRERLVMAVVADLDLVGEIMVICEKHGARLYLPDPLFDDFATMHAEVHIIDRWYMGKEFWGAYCDYLDRPVAGRGQAATAGGGQTSVRQGQASVRGRQASLLNGSAMDTTPLIITDWRMDRSVQEFRSPNKPADVVFTVEGGATDIVTLIVKKVLQGVKHIDFAQVIQEVNAERLAGL